MRIVRLSGMPGASLPSQSFGSQFPRSRDLRFSHARGADLVGHHHHQRHSKAAATGNVDIVI